MHYYLPGVYECEFPFSFSSQKFFYFSMLHWFFQSALEKALVL